MRYITNLCLNTIYILSTKIRNMECFSPIRLKQKGNFQDVPCSKCKACKINYRNGWINRAYVETRYSKTQAFSTLTVAEEYLQFKEYLNEETGEIQVLQTVTKERLQAFIKKIRQADKRNHKKHPLEWTQKQHPSKNLGVGEYGEITFRQHYHLLSWNLHPKTIKQLEEMWIYGSVDLGRIESGSIAYVVSHQMMEHKEGMHPEQKPFSLKSNNIGSQYLAIHKKSHAEGRQWFLSEMKSKMAIPQGFRRKLWPEKKTERAKLILKIQKQKRTEEIEYKAGKTILEINLQKIKATEARKRFFSVGKKTM